jgi:hypothetical protein
MPPLAKRRRSASRHCAPVLQLGDGLDLGAVMMVLQGTIPNQLGVPVVHELVAVLHREP